MGCGEENGCCCCELAKVASGASNPLHDGGPELAEGDVGGGVSLGDAAAGTRAQAGSAFTRGHNFEI